MANKIFYWCPFIDKVGTVQAVINSAHSIAKFDRNYKPIILNTVGEWDDYRADILKKNIQIKNLTESKILNNNNRRGFFNSRVLYIKIILRLIFPLISFLKEKKDNYLIICLITSLPLFLNIFFNKKNIILRISGLPKFTILRKLLWNYGLRKVKYVFCSTIETKKNLMKLFPNYKLRIRLVREPIINTKEILKKKGQINDLGEKEYFLSIGRLTKQKNYILLLKLIKNLNQKNIIKKFIIIGEGEEKFNLLKYIKENNLENFVQLIGYKKNVFPYLRDSNALISTSLWEDPGFTIIEAGYCDIPVISSNCPNGPEEILNNGEGGYLFKSNSIKDFQEIFEVFLNDKKELINKKKILTKKMSKEFTIFSHYKNFLKNINE
tara:strand:- start:78 stop:1217 length:1140 start_codon:yes stop_codon:yes gene_type:complete